VGRCQHTRNSLNTNQTKKRKSKMKLDESIDLYKKESNSRAEAARRA
jgi:hypothetical protein